MAGPALTAPLRVAIDVTPLIGVRTGIGQFVAAVVDDMQRRDDIRLHPYVVSWRAGFGRAVWPAQRARGQLGSLPEGTKALPYPAGVAHRMWSRWSWPTGRGLIGRGALRGAAVVHGTNFVAPPSGLPTVISVHDGSIVTHPEWCSPAARAFVPVIRRLVAGGAWIHALSAHAAGELGELFGTRRVVAVPLAPAGNAPARLAEPAAEAPYVLTIGALEPRKNQALLVRAVRALHERHPELVMKIVGPDGAARAAVEAARAGDARIELAGLVDDQRREALLAGASAFVFPSLDEGFGMPVLEAMRAGVPVIASRAGALPEVAGDAAILVDAHDEAGWSSAIDHLLSDGGARARAVQLGQQRASAFTWSATVDGLLALYRRALEGDPPR